MYQKFSGKVKELIEFASGARDVTQDGRGENEWLRALGYYLAIKVPPTIELTKVLTIFKD